MRSTESDPDMFRERGFVILPELLPAGTVAGLNDRLTRILLGEYDRGAPPDKVQPKKTKRLDTPSKRTVQIVNAWKCDSQFQKVVLDPALGKIVARVSGWNSARVVNDQVWAKPPLSSSLTFHRDSAYFDFTPASVTTVWIALDDMVPEMGPLEYVSGSHLWNDERFGGASQFFPEKRQDNRALMHDAARRQGLSEKELDVVQVSVKAGGCGIHNGRLWHGSGPNQSPTQPRRGLGIHFVAGDACFSEAENVRKTLSHRQAVADDSFEGRQLPNHLFPLTYQAD